MSNETLNLMGIPTDVAAAEPVKLVEPKVDRILMSDSLQGNMPELEGGQVEEMAASFVIVTINVDFPGKGMLGFAGSLRSLMYDGKTVELETAVQLDDGLRFLEDPKGWLLQFVLHPGEDEPIKRFETPHSVEGCRLMDIDYRRGMCTLLLQLKPASD
jgi:hypothetical protein